MLRPLLAFVLVLQGAFTLRTDAENESTMLYDEPLRPQFHFTAQKNWLNDPNGLVYFGGEYHLFFQHNPLGIEWGNMTWGHAVSADLVHWRQIDNALLPDALGTMFSGSAIVDWDNTAGFRTGSDPALVAIYTAAGGVSPESKGKPFTQCVAYSNDRGRTWTKYAGNPVLPNIVKGNRDPKVVWHAPTRRWVMAIYRDGNNFALYNSADLKHWQHLQDLNIPGSDECPDFFEMPLEGEKGQTRWIFSAANGRYLVGAFDGVRFTAESGPHPSDFGGNYYAVQSYSGAPQGRRIQIAWMRDGKYPGMPFNQQMSFPCDLTLRNTSQRPRIFRQPVPEIEKLYGETREFNGVSMAPDAADPLTDVRGDCFDVTMTWRIADPARTTISLLVRGHPLTFCGGADAKAVTFMDHAMPVSFDPDGSLRVRLLIDRTSLEVFANDGAAALSSCFVPMKDAPPLALQVKSGAATCTMKPHALKSIWSER